jgi:biotin synthase-like enzyme
MKQLVSIENITIQTVQVSTLLSIKTGGCPEDCGYCPQAARYHTSVEGNDLMSVSQVKVACEQNQVGLPEYVWEQPGET